MTSSNDMARNLKQTNKVIQDSKQPSQKRCIPLLRKHYEIGVTLSDYYKTYLKNAAILMSCQYAF